ncbi:MAG: hypothetical protein MI919_06410 [Holophagales bacterium]|nr:hypothetical protein [Holophagales bacterium]
MLQPIPRAPRARRPASSPERVEHLVEELTRRVRRGLRHRLAEHARRGRPLDEIGSPEELAERMLDAIPEASGWNEVLGPFYTTRQVARRLGGASRQAIADRRKRGTILWLETSDGVLAYPAFQFDGPRVIPGLAEVLSCFRGVDVDRWTVAGWLASSFEELGGRSVIEWLREGHELEAALALARDAAERFGR